MVLSAADLLQLKEALQIAVVKCSERCLYNSAKWYLLALKNSVICEKCCWSDTV